MEVAALLALMISSSAEDHQLFLNNYSCCKEAQLKSNVLLDNVKSLMKDVKVGFSSFAFLVIKSVLILMSITTFLVKCAVILPKLRLILAEGVSTLHVVFVKKKNTKMCSKSFLIGCTKSSTFQKILICDL